MLRFTLAIIIFFALAAPARADGTLPWVEEKYDAICVCYEGIEDEPQWQRVRIWFFRNGKPVTSRFLTDDMQLATDGERFVLTWRDSWICDRVISAPSLVYIARIVPKDGDPSENWAWNDARRVMVDLAAPPAEAGP